MGKIMKSSVERAAGEVRKQRERLAQLVAEKVATEAEALSLQRRAGDEVRDDETGTAAARLARSLGDMRARVEILGQAIAAQEPRVKAAERAYLEAEAEEAEKPLAAARAALTRHQARTNELLRLLEEHEGRFISEAQHIDELRWAERRHTETAHEPGMPGIGPVLDSFEAPKSWAMQGVVEEAQRSVGILRALAEGREPRVVLGDGQTLADVYPSCVWGPDALVPAPAYLRAVESARHRVEQLDELATTLPERIAQAEASETPARGVMGLHNVRRRLEALPAERERAQRQLAALTGEADQADDSAAAS
jgi:hypothetical protein